LRRATFGNWRLAAEQGFALIIARAEFQDLESKHELALEFDPKKIKVECRLQTGEVAVLFRGVAW
jgi:hypothetical protein